MRMRRMKKTMKRSTRAHMDYMGLFIAQESLLAYKLGLGRRLHKAGCQDRQDSHLTVSIVTRIFGT